MVNFNNLPSNNPNTLINPNEAHFPRERARNVGRTAMELYDRMARMEEAKKQMEASYNKTFQAFDNAQKKALDINSRTLEAIEQGRRHRR